LEKATQKCTEQWNDSISLNNFGKKIAFVPA
jgi:hypothetical protein